MKKKFLVIVFLLFSGVGVALLLLFSMGGGEKILRAGDFFQIPRSVFEEDLSNIEGLYSDVILVPYYQEKKMKGFKLINTKRGSFFDKLGFKRGDILKTVNGTSFTLETGLGPFIELEGETKFDVELERRGESKIFHYEIVE